MTTILFEGSNWLAAVLAMILTLRIAWWAWPRSTPGMLWLIWILCWLGLFLLYVLKAAEVSLVAGEFRLEWGLGRRWGDVSHWFILLLLCTAWLPALGAFVLSIQPPKELRLGYVIGVALGHVVYLLLVRAGDRGFFFPESWLTGIKWIQVAEGVLIVFLIAAAQLFVCYLIVTLIESVVRWRHEVQTLVVVLAAYLTGLFTVSSIVIIKAPFALTPTIQWLVTDAMPGYEAEFRGPKTNLVVYQVVGLVIVPFLLTMFIAWIYASRRISNGSRLSTEDTPPL